MGIISCDSELYDGIHNLSCDKKIFSEIISIISLVFSLFVFFISIKKVKMNITNVLIFQIIISEVLDGINIILSIVSYFYQHYTFENYPDRMGICLTQIYLGVFSCLWNLFSSFFISLRIYDKMENKNRIFSNKFMYDYTTTMSYGIPCIISYIMWSAQVINQSNTANRKKYESFYPSNSSYDVKTTFFRYMYCWVSGTSNYILFGICFILIAANIYFSIFKSVIFIKKVSNEIEEKEDSGRKSIQNKIRKIKQMMRSLILYPVVSCIVWILYFILQIFTGLDSESIERFMRNGLGAWLLIIVISLRQFIFTFLFFWTQGNLKKYAWDYITCKKSKNSKKKKNDSEAKLFD
jgi:predicted secreted protein